MTLFVNGCQTPVEATLRTWGDLVGFLDERLAAGGEVMTAVRLDGVEEPAFRDPALCAETLAALGSIEVESGSPQALARRCLSDASEALDALGQGALRAADQFRCGRIDDGRQALGQISQGLLTVLRIIAAAGLALRRELDAATCDGQTLASLTACLDRAVSDLVAGQQDEDWIAVADVLEFDLEPATSSLRGTLEAVG